ncbi:MAG: hypothetical protein CMK92_06640 [Pseudomonas sp.]|nr:hypothetical protein [Pseudomonas sp.]|tara:strand:- start:106 stop:822 length:717 start_codon:yes stop_codon:yes gene_type:complete
MTNIIVTKTETGYSVKIPFCVSNSFKSVLKSASWDRYSRSWKIGPRSKKRLEQWIAVAEQELKVLQEAEAELLTQQELMKVQKQLADLVQASETIQRLDNTLSDTLSLLKAANKEFDLAKQRHSEAVCAKNKKLKDTKAQISEVCSLEDILDAQQTMVKWHGIKKSYARVNFNEAQAVIDCEQEKLKECGFVSKGMEYLIKCNFNRPDRDRPRDVTHTDLFTESMKLFHEVQKTHDQY